MGKNLLLLVLIMLALFPSVNGLDTITNSSPIWSDKLGRYGAEIACSDNGSFIIAGSDNGILRMFDRTGRTIWTYSTNSIPISSVSISGDGGIVTADSLILDHQGNLLANINNSNPVIRTEISHNGNTILSSGDRLEMFDLKGNLLGKYAQQGAVWDVALSGDGKYGAAAVDLGWQTRKGKIIVIDRNGSEILDYPTMSQGVGVGISDDGSSIVSIDDYNLYSIFRNGTLRWNFQSSPPFRDVAITPDGKYVVAGSQYYLRFFNESGSLLWQKQENGYVSSVAISEIGDYVIAGYSDQVRLFDKSGNVLWRYGQGASHVAASKDGEYFVVSTNNEIKYFNKWGNSTFVVESNIHGKSTSPNNSLPVAIPPTSKPAPLSSLVAIGSLFCMTVIVSFSKKIKPL
jgi:hypothetical protein